MGEGEFGLANALVGGQAINPAAAETARIAYGGELGQNPFLESQFNRAANVAGENFRENVIPGMDTEYAQAGARAACATPASAIGPRMPMAARSTISPIKCMAASTTRTSPGAIRPCGQLGGLGQQDVANRLAGAGLYQQGRQNVFAGLGQAAGIDAMRYADPTRLFEAGGLIQNAPWGPLQQGAQTLGALQFPSSQTTQENPNPFDAADGHGDPARHGLPDVERHPPEAGHRAAGPPAIGSAALPLPLPVGRPASRSG